MTTGINAYYNPYYQQQNSIQQQQQKAPYVPTFASTQNPNLTFQGGVQHTEVKDNVADGKDDGSIGFFGAVKNIVKGAVKTVTGLFTDENGSFSLGKTLKTLGTAALIGAATFIPVVGPLVLPALTAYGVLDGGLKIAKGAANAMTAETDAEAEAAWQDVGGGALEAGLSYYGYKQTGGLKAGWNKSVSQFNSLTSKAATLETAAGSAAAEAEALRLPAPEEPLGLPSPKTTDIAPRGNNPFNPNPTTDLSTEIRTGAGAAGAEAEAAASAGAKASAGAETASATAGAAQEAAANMDVLNSISGKLASRGGSISRLTPAEQQQLANILDVGVESLGNISKATLRKAFIKYHPDKMPNNPEFANVVSQILSSIKNNVK